MWRSAGASERMITDVYRHKLSGVTDLGPSDSQRHIS